MEGSVIIDHEGELPRLEAYNDPTYEAIVSFDVTDNVQCELAHILVLWRAKEFAAARLRIAALARPNWS